MRMCVFFIPQWDCDSNQLEMLGCQNSWLLVYCTCMQRANMPTLTGSFQPACPYQALHPLLPITASATSNWAALDFDCTGSDPSDLLSVTPYLFYNSGFVFFSPFLSEEKASGTWQHWRHTHRCRKNIIKGFFPPRPMCFWTWQSIRISFVKTFRMRSDLLALMTQGQGGLLLCLLLCWLSWEAIRVISVQPLGWLTGRWTEAPRIFRYAEELFQECGHGRWPLYHQIIPADNCLLPLLPGVSTAACVCLLGMCVEP